MLMRSRHNGHCETCQKPFSVGLMIYWSAQDGAHHPECWARRHNGELTEDFMDDDGDDNEQ